MIMSLLPLLKCKKFILVGDNKQLQPIEEEDISNVTLDWDGTNHTCDPNSASYHCDDLFDNKLLKNVLF